MDQLKEDLAIHLLKTGSHWLEPRQFEGIVTMFLLFGHGEPLYEAAVGNNAGRYKLDSEFISRLYESCPDSLKLALFDTFALSRLEPTVFARLVRHAWAIPSTNNLQRKDIAERLEGFCMRHPESAKEHREIILQLLRSPNRWLCTKGLLLVSYLDDVEPKNLAHIRRKLSAAAPEPRMNALNGLCLWLRRHHELSPRVLAFCTSPALKKEVARILRSDVDKDVRTCAHFMLKALREATAPKAPASRATRTPRPKGKTPAKPSTRAQSQR